MYKEGIVVNSNDGMARVAVNRSSSCGGGCKTCGGCDTPEVFVDLPNTIRAKTGDRVRLRANNSRLFLFQFLIYIVPVALMVVGIFVAYQYFTGLGASNVELKSFGIGLVFLGISAIFIKLLDTKVGKDDSSFMVIDKITGSIVE